MRKIKIGQIGIGHDHAAPKAKFVGDNTDLFEFVGFTEPDERWLKKRGNLPCYKNLRLMSADELLSYPGLDAVLVENDVPDLEKTARLCIDAGKHIHMDKPAGESFRDYEKLMLDAKAKGLTVQMGYMYRNNRAVMKMLELVKNGSLGDIHDIDSMMSTDHSADFRRPFEEFQGGSMYIYGCHLIDLIVEIMGEPKEIVPFKYKSMKEGVDCYDNDFAVLVYDKGVATVRTSSIEVNGFGRRQFVVCGTKGTVEIKPLEPPLLSETYAENSKMFSDSREVTAYPAQGRYDSMLRDFAAMVRGEMENPFTYEHDILVHKITLKACGIDTD